MSNITQLIEAASAGDRQAAEDVLPLVYDELRKLAAQRLSQERHGHSLQATALVHEAYLRLVTAPEPSEWNGRGHFFSAAAEAMQRILVESARRRQTLKRGGDWERLNIAEIQLAVHEPQEDLLALDEALRKLAESNSEAAQLVRLRYFAGLSVEESGRILGISPRSAGRIWQYARAWLRAELDDAA